MLFLSNNFNIFIEARPELSLLLIPQSILQDRMSMYTNFQKNIMESYEELKKWAQLIQHPVSRLSGVKDPLTMSYLESPQ